MSQKEVQKRREISIEEDKDFYLSFVNKKLRNIRKKLEQIDELAKKDVKTLKPEQIEKINSRPDVLQNIQHFEELKDIYYSAYKVGLEEGKITPKEISIEKTGKSNKADKAEAVKNETIKETLQKVLNLLSFSQALENPIVKEGLQTEEKANFENIQQFCQEVLNFRTNEGEINIKERQTQSLEKLFSYVKSEESYKSFQETVDKTLETSTFENIIQAHQEKSKKVETIQVEQPQIEKVVTVERELPTGAAVLKPDSGDVNISPEKAQFIPKVVRFVDDIEKEFLTAYTPNLTNGPEQTQEILKESRETSDKNKAEEEREDTQGDQEMKSFRKKRYNDDYGQSKYYNNDRRPQSNRGGNYPKRGHKENKYEGSRNYSKGDDYYQPRGGNAKYQQYKQYVEKKPQEA